MNDGEILEKLREHIGLAMDQHADSDVLSLKRNFRIW